MEIAIDISLVMAMRASSVAPTSSLLLMEDGSRLLLEDGSAIILDEV